MSSNKNKLPRNPLQGPIAGKVSQQKQAFSLAWDGENSDTFRTESQSYGKNGAKGGAQRASSQKRVLAENNNRDAIDNLADQMAGLQLAQHNYYNQQQQYKAQGQAEEGFGKRVVKREFDPWNEGSPNQQQQQQQLQPSPVLAKPASSSKNQSTFSFGEYNYFTDPDQSRKGNLPNKNIRKVVQRDEGYLQQQQQYDYAPAQQLPPTAAYPPNGYRVNQPPGGKSNITLG